MKKQILYIISLLMMSLAAASCAGVFDDADLSDDSGRIVLHFQTPGVAVKGTIEDNACESYMSHLDVLIYEYENSSYTPFHYERISVSATPQGTVSLHKTKNDFKEKVGYKFFVIANSTLEESIFKNGDTIIPYDKFLDLDQTDELIHLSGVDHHIMNPHYPQMFLMDGVAYMGESEPATPGHVVVNNGTTDDVVLKVTLRRAAAKILITIIPGDKVTFDSKLMALSDGYLIRNMPNRTTLAAEGGYPLNEQGAKPYWKSTTISQSPYFNMVKVKDDKGVERDGMQLTAYCYSHEWEPNYVFERGTSVVMMLPLKYKEADDKEAVEYVNNYYQFSVTKNLHIKRNTVYDLRIKLNAPGAEDITTPEEVKGIQYFTAPWEIVNLPVSGENTVKYLKVNKEKIYMYNVADDNTSLYFSSSSPVTVTLVSGSAHYYDKYNEKKSVSNNEVNSIKGTTETGAVSGNISVHSDIPTNNTIRYFQLKVTNEEGLSEIVDVEQYPLIYITNGLPWYSYRDDYYYRANQGHTYRDNVSQSTNNGNNPTTYQYTGDRIVSIYTINTNIDIDNKKVTYTYTSAAPKTNYGWTCSKVRGSRASDKKLYNINYYHFDKNGSQNTSKCETHNVRNYHVRVMASSKDYTVGRPDLDEYGYTDDSPENAKLVSPSFVIASRLGAVLSTYSNLSRLNSRQKLVVFADHCKNYVEVDDINDDGKNPVEVHDNWRLPTEAELKIIMDLQGGDGVDAPAIDFLLNGGYYMSASGPVFNPKNTSGVKQANDKWSVSDVAIRCVRDAF